jgi:hypothetical protein
MRATELLRIRVFDGQGHTLGRVNDVHLVQDGPHLSMGMLAFRVHGIVVGRTSLATRLGYRWPNAPRVTGTAGQETEGMRGPWPIRALANVLSRHARYIPWSDVRELTPSRIVVELSDDSASRHQ